MAAPLSGGTEMTKPKLSGLDEHSHVRLAHPDANDGIRILRRGLQLRGREQQPRRLDAGLFFPVVPARPQQFIALQRKLSTDLLNEYIRHVGPGIWAIPAGAPRDRTWARAVRLSASGATRLSCAGPVGSLRRSAPDVRPRRRTSSAVVVR